MEFDNTKGVQRLDSSPPEGGPPALEPEKHISTSRGHRGLASLRDSPHEAPNVTPQEPLVSTRIEARGLGGLSLIRYSMLSGPKPLLNGPKPLLKGPKPVPVSYTHLTLPTILRV